MNNTLYEITDKYLKVLDNLEIDEETGEILNAEELDELSGAFEEKSEAVACYIKNSEVFIGNLKAEEANLAKRRKQTEKRIDYLKNVLTACLDAAGRDKVETTKVRVSFRKSVAVSIDDEKALPADFVVVRRFPCGEPKPSNQIRRNRNERTFDSPSYRTRH